LDSEELAAAEGMTDPVVALTVLDAVSRGLSTRPAASTTWTNMMTVDELHGPGWLLSYEAARKKWLPAGHLQRQTDFQHMTQAGVEFYRVLPALAVPANQTGGGGGGGDFYD
jgi:hypothetical protein